MGWESSGEVGFDLGPLIQGQTRTAKLKSAYNSLIIGPRGLGGFGMVNQHIGNHGLIIGPRGFGALSLWWIQFASVLRCARSSF